jgi:hypothetical protein
MSSRHLALVIGLLAIPLTASADAVKTAGKVDLTPATPIFNATPAVAAPVNATVSLTTPTLSYNGTPPPTAAAPPNTTVNLTTPTLTYGGP